MIHYDNQQLDYYDLRAMIERELNSALAGDLAKGFIKGLAEALARGYSQDFAIEFAQEFAEGFAEGFDISKAKSKAREEAAIATTKRMLADGIDPEKVKKYTDLTDSQLAGLL